MPYNTRADGDVMTAALWNSDVRDQVISTVTSGAKPAGTEGQVIAVTDTNQAEVYSGSAWLEVFRWGAWSTRTW